ncbi:MAG: cysteine peptidase family C39 domain-containing protein [Armatimonadota bacterium]|nr:cysteine peptidase family C39 domain-containing protein [Armatimonadota bacterium]
MEKRISRMFSIIRSVLFIWAIAAILASALPCEVRAEEPQAEPVVASSSLEDEAEAAFEVGERYSRQWQYDKGYAVFQQVAAKYPGTKAGARAHACMGQYMKVAKRHYANAIKQYDKAIKMAPGTDVAAWARQEKGHALYMRGFYDEAIAEFDAVIASNPPVDILKKSVAWSVPAKTHRNERNNSGKPAGISLSGDPSCGPKSLLVMCRANKVKAKLDQLRKLTKCGANGTNLAQLVSAAKSVGLPVKAVNLTLDDLRKAPLPCLVWALEGHFVVVSKVKDRQVYLQDAFDGKVRMNLADFAAIWGGEALVVDKKNKPGWQVVAKAPELSMADLENAWGGCCGVSAPPVAGCDGNQPFDTPSGGNGPGVGGTGGAVVDIMPGGGSSCQTCGGFGGSGGGGDDCDECDGDPVNLFSGNEVLRPASDLVWSNCIGPAVVFRRTYNSQLAYNGHFGYGWTNAWDVRLTEDAARNVEVRKGDGGAWYFTWTGSAYLPRRGRYESLAKNADGSFTLTYARGGQRLGFDSQGWLVSISDRDGNALSLSYETIGQPGDPGYTRRLTTITDTSGGVTRLGYDGNNHCVSVTDPSNRSVSYTYLGDNLESVILPGNATYRYEYQWGSYISKIVTPSSGEWQFSYNGYQVRSITDPNDKTTSYWYGYSGGSSNSTTIQDARGVTSTVEYDAGGNQTGSRDALGGASKVEYDADLNVTKSTDANGNSTSYTYDSQGNMLTRTDALSARWSYEYNGDGQPTLTRDPLGRETRHVYSNGRLISRTDPTGATWSYTYLPNELLSTVQDPNDRVVAYGMYNAYGKPLEIRNSTGAVTRFTYDSRGNMESVTDPNGNTTTLTYDARDRLTRIIFPDGSTKAYYYQCCGLDYETDELDRETRYFYDRVGNIEHVQLPTGPAIFYQYDASYNLTRVTDPEQHATKYSYDAAGRLSEIIYADGTPAQMREQYKYDAAGNRIAKIDGNGVTTTYKYDAANRLVSASAPDYRVTYAYDAVGNRTRMVDPTGTSRYSYDAADRLVSCRSSIGETVNYTYDDDGNKTSVSTRFGTTQYQYDIASRLARVDSPAGAFTFRYNAAGQRIEQIGPASKTLYRYDSKGRLVSVRNLHPDDSPITTHDYVRDSLGNPVQVMEYDGTGNSRTYYQYDALDRLVSETRTGGAAPYHYHYTYDWAGNRLTRTDGTGQTIAYSYDEANRMRTAGAATFEYDDNGNTLNKTEGSLVTSYQWDSRNKLVRADLPGAETITYSYDGSGQRVQSVGPDGSSSYLFDPQAHIPTVLAFVRGGVPIYYTVNAAGCPIAESASGQNQTYVYNPQGTVVGTVDDAGNCGLAAYHDAWGDKLSTASATARGYEAAHGYWADQNVGLLMLGARWYDPRAGLFVSKDPIGYRGGLNLYVYAHTNPISNVDPSGTIPNRYPGPFDPIECTEWAKDQADPLHGENDKWAHCTGACLGARWCAGLSPGLIIIGIIRNWDQDPYDNVANMTGGGCAYVFSDCQSCCRCAVSGLPNTP